MRDDRGLWALSEHPQLVASVPPHPRFQIYQRSLKYCSLSQLWFTDLRKGSIAHTWVRAAVGLYFSQLVWRWQ